MLAAGQGTALGIFSAAVLVGGYVLIAALWYFMVRRPSKRAHGQAAESHDPPREQAISRDDPESSKD